MKCSVHPNVQTKKGDRAEPSSPPPDSMSLGRGGSGTKNSVPAQSRTWAGCQYAHCSHQQPPSLVPSLVHCIHNRQCGVDEGEGRVPILGSYLCNFGWHNNLICTSIYSSAASIMFPAVARGLSRPVLVASICLAKLDSCTNTFQGAENFPIPCPACTQSPSAGRDSAILNPHFYTDQRSFCFIDILSTGREHFWNMDKNQAKMTKIWQNHMAGGWLYIELPIYLLYCLCPCSWNNC